MLIHLITYEYNIPGQVKIVLVRLMTYDIEIKMCFNNYDDLLLKICKKN